MKLRALHATVLGLGGREAAFDRPLREFPERTCELWATARPEAVAIAAAALPPGVRFTVCHRPDAVPELGQAAAYAPFPYAGLLRHDAATLAWAEMHRVPAVLLVLNNPAGDGYADVVALAFRRAERVYCCWRTRWRELTAAEPAADTAARKQARFWQMTLRRWLQRELDEVQDDPAVPDPDPERDAALVATLQQGTVAAWCARRAEGVIVAACAPVLATHLAGRGRPVVLLQRDLPGLRGAAGAGRVCADPRRLPLRPGSPLTVLTDDAATAAAAAAAGCRVLAALPPGVDGLPGGVRTPLCRSAALRGWLRGRRDFALHGKRFHDALLRLELPVPSDARLRLLLARLYPAPAGALRADCPRDAWRTGGEEGEAELILVECAPVPQVSVVIPSRDGMALLRTLLPRSLAAVRSDGIVAEWLVADDGSTDGTAAALAREFPAVRVVPVTGGAGFGAAANAGVQAAAAPCVLLLNNDACLTPGALRALLLLLQGDVAAVDARLTGADGRQQEGARTLRTGAWLRVRPRAAEAPCPTAYGSGAALLVDRAAFLAAGGFAPLFAPAYAEDYDLGLRLWRGGRRVLHQPLAQVVHTGAQTTGRGGEAARRALLQRNLWLLHWRHFSTAQLLLQAGWAPFIIAAQVLRYGLPALRGFLQALPHFAAARRARVRAGTLQTMAQATRR